MTQQIRKVRKVVITTEDGTEHTFEGVEGSASIRSKNYVGLGVKNQPYQLGLTVSLSLPPQKDVKA